jgi:hypothetical protein
MRRSHRAIGVVISAIASICLSNTVNAQDIAQFSISSGVDYANGDFGAISDTDYWRIPITANYDTGSWAFRVTVPYVHIKGPGAIVGGTDGILVVDGAAAAPVTKEDGLGDVVASASYTISPSTVLMPYIELTGKIKFPTADEDDGLGTGEFDYTIQADFFQSIGKISPYVTIGYRFHGDSSSLDLNDTLLVSTGFGYQLRQDWSAGFAYDHRKAASKTSTDAHELVPYVSWRPLSDWSLSLYGVIGLSDGSPDAGVGLQIKYFAP